MAVVDDFYKGRDLPLKVDCPVFYIHASEETKTLATVEAVVRWLLEQQADRDTLLLGIGGGIVTDIAGLAASIYKRGMPYGLIPTTLLAQVDAAIGGKCGVNFDGYKNVLGCFSGPQFIYIDPSLTATLQPRQTRCGAAEMLKTFLIADAGAFDEAVRYFASGRRDEAQLEALVKRAVGIKCRIVEDDPFDRGGRHVLNLGHTFAHAIEKCTREYLHGEAVAIGIVKACEMSVKEGLLRPEAAQAIERGLSLAGLPTTCPAAGRELQNAILQDKKRSGATLKYILLEDIGKPLIWEQSVTA